MSRYDTILFPLAQDKTTDVAAAFILYRQNHQASVAAHNPGLANPDISKIIGKQWSNESEDEKNRWKAYAEVSRACHAVVSSTCLLLCRKKSCSTNNDIHCIVINPNGQVAAAASLRIAHHSHTRSFASVTGVEVEASSSLHPAHLIQARERQVV